MAPPLTFPVPAPVRAWTKRTTRQPGAKEEWNRATKTLDKFETPNAPPYITWGWISAVAIASANEDMAFDFPCFFSNESNTTIDLQIGRFGVLSYRTTHFDPRCGLQANLNQKDFNLHYSAIHFHAVQ